MPVSVNCDNCGNQIEGIDEIICFTCYDARQAEIEKKDETITSLNNKIKELKKIIKDYVSDMKVVLDEDDDEKNNS